MRLPRERKGKTTVDVTNTLQAGIPRVRLSMGRTDDHRFRNTDMSPQEVRDLITLLEYHLAIAEKRIEVPQEDGHEIRFYASSNTELENK